MWRSMVSSRTYSYAREMQHMDLLSRPAASSLRYSRIIVFRFRKSASSPLESPICRADLGSQNYQVRLVEFVVLLRVKSKSKGRPT